MTIGVSTKKRQESGAISKSKMEAKEVDINERDAPKSNNTCAQVL